MKKNIFEWTKTHYQNQSQVIFFSYLETTSTNEIAKQYFDLKNFERNLPMIFLAQKQSSGKGQHGRTWLNAENPQGALLISYVFFSKQPPQPDLTPKLGIQLKDVLEKIWNISDLKIKSPNDLYKADKKCAGFLVEVISQNSLYQIIIGMGLNIYSSPIELDIAGKLMEENELHLEDWIKFLTLWEQKIRSQFIY